MRRIRTFVTSAVSVAMVGVFAFPGVVQAAALNVTVTDGTTAVAGAFVALVNTSTGAAVDAVVSGADGKASLDDAGTALASLKVIVSKQGYDTATAASVSAETAVALKASTSSALKFSNVFGAQTQGIVADAESGVFYGITGNVPSVWRTTDYAGTWAPVPTTADASTGLPQQQAQKVATSGYQGEVAVSLRNGLWYSRDYGTTWASLDTQAGFNNVWWVHAGTSSYLFAQTGAVIKVAVMSVVTPSLSDWTLPAGSPAATDVWTFAAGSQASNQVLAAAAPRDGATSVKVFALATGKATAAEVTASSTITTSGLTFANTNTSDILMISTLGTANLHAIAAYDKEGTGTNIGGTTGALRLAYTTNGGGSFTYSTGAGNLVGPNNFDSMTPWNSYSVLGSSDATTCGENETAPVGSIAPVSPGAGVYSSFAFVGTIRQCMFAMNTTGSTAKWANVTGADVAAGKTALLPMQGANNGTGFAFDAGFDFSTNWVAISGDGQFGFRKSAAAFASPTWRPGFGNAGQGRADDFILNQAKPGKGTDSGGISVNGIVAPTVQDVTMAPNSTDGSTYIVSTGESGGSRTMLTTDGGKSFSTINSAGATQLDWWNGADGKQWILGGAPLTLDNYFQVKWFSTATGTTANQMGEELAATAAQRDSATDSTLRFTTNSSPLAPLGATCFGLDRFVNKTGTPCTGGPYDTAIGKYSMTASAGIVGTDRVLVGVSRGQLEQQDQTKYGSVALFSMTASPSNDGATISEARYFGANVPAAGTTSDATTQFGVSKTATYDGVVTAIAYCPTGSAPQVADKAFVAVHGKGVYVISSVSGTPAHAATPVSSTSFKDLKADCDTGLLAGASATGPQLSFDGGATFVALRVNNVNDTATVDVQANAANGDVSVLAASGGNVAEVDTSFKDLGTTGEAAAAGTAKTPATTPNLPATATTMLNEPSKGRDVGQVADVEFTNESGDKVTKSSVSAAGVHAAGVSAFAAADRKSQIASSSGSFSAALAQQTLTTLLPTAGTPAAPTAGTTPAAGTTPTGTPAGSTTSKISAVKKGKTISLALAVKKAGGTIPAKAKVVVSQTAASKKICKVIGVTKIQGLKKGTCAITVKVTPKATVKVKKPKTVTTKVSVSVT